MPENRKGQEKRQSGSSLAYPLQPPPHLQPEPQPQFPPQQDMLPEGSEWKDFYWEVEINQKRWDDFHEKTSLQFIGRLDDMNRTRGRT